MFIKRIIFILAAVIAAAPMFGVDPAHSPRLINDGVRDKIPGQYVVTLKVTNPHALDALVGEKNILRYYESKALFGFAAVLSPKALSEVLKSSLVSRVEANTRAAMTAAIPKGIDRIDQRLLGPNGPDGFYNLPPTGEKVHVYVFDTGIRSTHDEFNNDNARVSGGFSYYAGGTDDCNGHGTHIAGTIGGKNYGVAKRVKLHPVRVLDCNGYGDLFSVLAGINWVMNNRIAAPMVVNMSLRLTYHSDTLDDAIRNSILDKITFVVAAGNLLGHNACAYSPADVTEAITVGSVNPANDKRSVLSATGECIDLFAPGVRILSATISPSSSNASEEMSGTSMAAAHVSGVAALYLQSHLAATPAQVWDAIHNSDDVQSTLKWPGIDNAGPCSPNEMLHWGKYNDGFDDADPIVSRKETNVSNH